MGTETEYKNRISKYPYRALYDLWERFRRGEVDNSFWKKGKLLEYIIIRAFELEIEKINNETRHNYGSVTYPYSVTRDDSKEIFEQIDGAVQVDGLYALIECKDCKKTKINNDPFAKLRSKLIARHSNVFGMFFTMTALTEPAKLQIQTKESQLILVWTEEEVEFCMKHELFLDCMKWKYNMAITYRNPIANYKEEKKDRYPDEPSLF